jgi:hypothetical protein
VKVCGQLGIDALVVKDVDPVWADENSWVWRLPVLARADRVIGLDCRGIFRLTRRTKVWRPGR